MQTIHSLLLRSFHVSGLYFFTVQHPSPRQTIWRTLHSVAVLGQPKTRFDSHPWE